MVSFADPSRRSGCAGQLRNEPTTPTKERLLRHFCLDPQGSETSPSPYLAVFDGDRLGVAAGNKFMRDYLPEHVRVVCGEVEAMVLLEVVSLVIQQGLQKEQNVHASANKPNRH